MANLFEEFSDQDPVYIDMGYFETEGQQHLRDQFLLLTEKNAKNVRQFDPEVVASFQPVRCTTGITELERSEPQLKSLYLQAMLKSLNIVPPKDADDPQLLVMQQFHNGKYTVIFTSDVGGVTDVPIYYGVGQGGDPELVALMSYAEADDYVRYNRELNDFHTKLYTRRIMSKKAMERLSIAELRLEHDNLTDGNEESQ